MTDSGYIRRRYFQLRVDACDLSVRDEKFSEIHNLFTREAQYEFDPETFMTDRLIPKGGILKAIQDCT